LEAVAHAFEITQKGFSHPFMVALIAVTTISDYELPAQNQIA
jgi:hypothetical protein